LGEIIKQYDLLELTVISLSLVPFCTLTITPDLFFHLNTVGVIHELKDMYHQRRVLWVRLGR